MRELEGLHQQLLQEAADAERLAAVQQLHRYDQTHARRMDYPRYRALGLPSGS